MQNAQFPSITIVVPVCNDDTALEGLLNRLEDLMGDLSGADAQQFVRVVVDGAGSAHTAKLVERRASYLSVPPGRGGQIAAGVKAAETDWIWVLHADTRPSAAALNYMLVLRHRADPAWGRFDVRIQGLGLIAGMMNWRSRLTSICTGDQAMFFRRSFLPGGFPPIPLMEDIEVSRTLKHSGACFLAPAIDVEASPRRWRRHGVMRTVLFMWWTRLRYFFGVSAETLYAAYYGSRR